METLTLLIFCILLFSFLLADISILWALVAGLFLFSFYAYKKGFHIKDIVRFSLMGIHSIKNILLTFLLIGMLTALWRASGTISTIVCFASRFISGNIFLLMAFLLNALISFLTGTSFGTAATMGVIISTMGSSLGISPALTGGAVLSGIFFGDRCSPLSTSALLVSTITSTDIYSNIRKMFQTAAMPFALTSALYFVLGYFLDFSGSIIDLTSIFAHSFSLSFVTVLPALILLVLSLLRINVKITMLASIITSIPIAILIEDVPFRSILPIMLFGYKPEVKEIAQMLGGGGVISMVKISLIVAISSAYAGIFQHTGLLDKFKSEISSLSKKTTPYFSTLITSILISIISCNQTLSIILTNELSKDNVKDKNRMAIMLENTAIVISPLVPWSIAGAVPLEVIGSPKIALAFACYLYFIPILNVLLDRRN